MAKLDSTKKRQIDRSIGAALFSDTERMEMWFNENWKRVAAAAVALVVVLTLAFAGVKYFRAREAEGMRALQKASSVTELTQALEKYSGNVGVPFARFRLAHKLFAGKEYEKSAAAFRAVIADDKSDQILVGSSKLQLAYLEEVSGNAKKAAELFAAVGDDAANTPALRAEADYSAARLYLDCGDVASAQKILGKIRQPGVTRAVIAWNRQLDELDLAVKSGDFKK